MTVTMDAPGFEPTNFDVRVIGDTLRVTAERMSDKGNGSHARRFQRSVALPATVDVEKVEANYRNGVLELSLPKIEKAKWKKIAVKG